MVPREAVTRALLEYSRRGMPLTKPSDRILDRSLPEADALVDSDPYAFLIAVLADYRVRASRAWNLPYLLKRRLGHLNPRKIASMQLQDLERVMTEPTACIVIRGRLRSSSSTRLDYWFNGTKAMSVGFGRIAPALRTFKVGLKHFTALGRRKRRWPLTS